MSKARDLANAGTALTTVSATELGYLDGVTSAVQTQIDAKIGQSTAINPTIVDAKGDIIAASAADTVARLAVGANDTVLTADSSTATGLKWATPSAGGMTLISTTTLTGSSVTLSSIPTTYKHLYMTVHNAWSAANSNLQFQMNGDTGANYSWSYVYGNTPAANGSIGTTNIRAAVLSSAGGSFSAEVIIQLPNYTDTTGPQLLQTNGWWAFDRTTINAAGIYHNRSAAITSLTIFTGSTFSSGTVRLYGVN